MNKQMKMDETMPMQDEATESSRSRIWMLPALFVFVIFLGLLIFFAVSLFS